MGAELMITGNQIRQARKLLGWPSSRLAQRAKVHSAIVRRAESVDGEPPITVYQAALIRDALGRFGIEFTNGDAPGVKLTATKARKGGKRSLGSRSEPRASYAAGLRTVSRRAGAWAIRSFVNSKPAREYPMRRARHGSRLSWRKRA